MAQADANCHLSKDHTMLALLSSSPIKQLQKWVCGYPYTCLVFSMYKCSVIGERKGTIHLHFYLECPL